MSHASLEAGEPAGAAPTATYVTGTIGDQLFGLPIGRVHDVFNLGRLTPVPLAPPDILGLMNLRGRVVTAIDLRHRLGLPQRRPGPDAMAVGIDAGPDAFGLVIDRIGEIVTVENASPEANPVHLHPAWAALSRGVHRLEDGLLVVLDLEAALAAPRNDPELSSPTEPHT